MKTMDRLGPEIKFNQKQKFYATSLLPDYYFEAYLILTAFPLCCFGCWRIVFVCHVSGTLLSDFTVHIAVEM